MSGDIVRKLTPEERELNKKRIELTGLETLLAERELDLATLRAELHSFERQYLRVVGVLYAELDAIAAQIAVIYAALDPRDQAAQEKMKEAQNRARTSAQEAEDNLSRPQKGDFIASDDLKRLYREIAKRLHPDLITDETERIRRHTYMAEVNRAYEEGNEERLRSILDEWENEQSEPGSGVGAELVRLIRKIAQVEDRLQKIGQEFVALQKTDMFKLRERVNRMQALGRDLLAELAATIRRDILAQREALSVLQARGHKS
jgi:hypothetical protein